ncbi:MAG: histidine--tRNA ligase, partial [Oscillospiraceae bacterium]|nr:histidine--tRNA ligase [Oscillospiraceae bacterium]
GYRAEFDTMNRGIKPQMKYANKIGAAFVIVLGDNELESGTVKLKNMSSGEQVDIALDDRFIDNFSNIFVAEMFDGMEI